MIYFWSSQRSRGVLASPICESGLYLCARNSPHMRWWRMVSSELHKCFSQTFIFAVFVAAGAADSWRCGTRVVFPSREQFHDKRVRTLRVSTSPWLQLTREEKWAEHPPGCPRLPGPLPLCSGRIYYSLNEEMRVCGKSSTIACSIRLKNNSDKRRRQTVWIAPSFASPLVEF